MLPLALERLWQPRLPRAYRPGATLARLAQDLNGLEVVGAEEGCPAYRLPAADWFFRVEERVESQFLLHTVSCCFVLALPGTAPSSPSRLQLQHRGNWQRSGFACLRREGAGAELAGLMVLLQQDRDLHTALMPLDFKRCELIADEQGWRLEVEHFAASEVVGSFPPFRRYIRLLTTQKLALLAVMAAVRRVVGCAG
ncbi:DUF3156 family protein [Aquitalea sp. ASV11]|uniref:DUF3156 family protein n=1 Tax=Aquitalea sp. ASV11 TaxID=2795103 RepID=UPI0018EC88AC